MGGIPMKCTLLPRGWIIPGKTLIPAAAVFIALALSACGGSSGGGRSPAAPASSSSAPVPAAAPSVIRITQTTENATGAIVYLNYYSNGTGSRCTGMLERATGNYNWIGDCVPDGK
jgi:hypothetical protein